MSVRIASAGIRTSGATPLSSWLFFAATAARASRSDRHCSAAGVVSMSFNASFALLV